MNFHSLRKALFAGVTLVTTAALISSCGGGGTADTQQTGGFLRMQPENSTVYAGVPFTITVTGSQMPYNLTSSEPLLLPVPLAVSTNYITLVAANPGVVDANLQPGELPVRTVTISGRSANGQLATMTVKVAQNFLMGYNISFPQTSCTAPATGTAPPACGGGQTQVRFTPVTSGNLYGGKQFKIEALRGPFTFLKNDGTSAGTSITTQSDHNGIVSNVIFQVPTGVDSQLATIRIYDVATGAYADYVFLISKGTGTSLTITPSSLKFTGALSTDCGTGQSDVFVFDGKPPYTALSSDSSIYVNDTSTTQPGKFTVRAVDPATCVSGGTVIILDSAGNRGTLTVDTAKGTGTLPTLTVSPASLTLVCGSGGSAQVVGGAGNYSTNSSHPRVTSVISGSTVTVTRLTGDGATVYPTTAVVNVTDGASIATINVTIPGNCP